MSEPAQESPIGTPVPPTDVVNQQNVDTNLVEKPRNKFLNVLAIVLICAVIVAICWYAYGAFSSNRAKDGFISENAQERTDPQNDYNLREELDRLETMQREILKGISEVY